MPRPQLTYNAGLMFDLHSALAPFLAGTWQPRSPGPVSRPELTVRELAAWLDPPMSEKQLRLLIRALGIPAAGSRSLAQSPPGSVP